VRYEYAVTGPSQLRLVPGEARSMNFTVTNRGTVPDTIIATTATLGSGYTVALGAAGVLRESISLDPGASAQLLFTVGTPLEVDREWFLIDVDFQSENTSVQFQATLNATIGPVFDFRLTSVRLPPTAQVGKEVQIQVTVANVGSRAFTGQLTVRLLVGSTVYSTATLSSLALGAEELVVFRWTPGAAGDINLTVDLNRGGTTTYYESSLSDNVEARRLVVSPASAGGFFAESGFLLFALALVAVVIALLAVSRQKKPGAAPSEDDEKAAAEADERRKGKDTGGSGGIGRI
jgi:hypothetical protein